MITRVFNKEVSHNKLRLHSSERNTKWGVVFDDFKRRITDADIRFYPNTSKIHQRLKEFYGYDNLIMGFGSDRCIKYFFESNRCKNVIITDPTFPMYNVYSEIFDRNTISVPYDELNFPYMGMQLTDSQDAMIVISNPSSPIGNMVDIERILKLGVPTLVDEAYIEFSDSKSSIELIEKYDNLYACRTFSKALGSAGMRIGILLSQKQNIEHTLQYKDMYENSGLAIRWIETVLDHKN